MAKEIAESLAENFGGKFSLTDYSKLVTVCFVWQYLDIAAAQAARTIVL
jgi:hypothetical protein